MQIITKEKFMECLATWPEEIQEQIPLDDLFINCMINPPTRSPVDWINISWKKEEIDFNYEWMVKYFSPPSIILIDRMINSYFEHKNLVGHDDIERHSRMKKYLATNGTWPKPPVLAFIEEIPGKTLTVIDGCHRICQIIIWRRILDKTSPDSLVTLQDEGYVLLQEKHQIWIGS